MNPTARHFLNTLLLPPVLAVSAVALLVPVLPTFVQAQEVQAQEVQAQDDRYLSLQTEMPYEELSVLLQEAAMQQGWSIRFIQPVDTGFRNRGLDIGVMRILMLEPGDANKLVEHGGVALASLLPLRVMVYQESDARLVVSALRPSRLANASAPLLVQEQLSGWDAALEGMLEHVREFDLH